TSVSIRFPDITFDEYFAETDPCAKRGQAEMPCLTSEVKTRHALSGLVYSLSSLFDSTFSTDLII
ncbi:MAG: hypothetical protein K0Q48_875, partial [Bacillota bacterium]|nr:hypothetical protein [Bacillota bacterium]